MGKKATYEDKPIEFIKDNLKCLFPLIPAEKFENYEIVYKFDESDTNALFGGKQFLILFDRELTAPETKNGGKKQIIMRDIDLNYIKENQQDSELSLRLSNEQHEELRSSLDKTLKEVGVEMETSTADTDDYLSLIGFFEEIILYLYTTPRSGQKTLKTCLINARNFLFVYYSLMRHDIKNKYYLDAILQIMAFVSYRNLGVERIRDIRHLLEPAIDEVCAKFDICFDMIVQGSWVPGLVIGASLIVGYTMATAEPLIGLAVGVKGKQEIRSLHVSRMVKKYF
ncbi:uncharacterized protein TRIADDRAFT_54514 [Trichoplax adhaerens]|uniref:Uncharacterized protein n=1 Tax=Trichoplax adhaerens TaxID=10228 RepID=B3RS91_TRIAD|nr:predicted protein [Trichoplax adhaerens]EDV26475.1 predicted protein [Trichoplax adhaerens]|eukprot:XP_002110471.1 predicted protein [Trichoplax adhaerens]